MLARCARERPPGMRRARSARPAPPLPRRPRPRTDQAGAGERVRGSLLSCVSQSRVLGRGRPEPDLPPGPAVVPSGPTLSASVSASARGWSPGSGTPESPASSAPSRERAFRTGRQGRASLQPPGLRTPPTSSNWRFSFSLFSSSQMSVSFLLRTGGRGGGVGWADLEPPAPSLPTPLPLPTYSSCTPIRSSDLLKDSISSCSLIISLLSLLLSVRFCETRESRVGVSWGSGVDLIE